MQRIIPPAERNVLWRKIHVRLAALGLDKTALIDALYADEIASGRLERQRAAVYLAKQLAARTMSVERRREFETALALPFGALSGHVALEVVAAWPVPMSHRAYHDKSPDDGDVFTADLQPVDEHAGAVKAMWGVAGLMASAAVMAWPFTPVLELPAERAAKAPGGQV